ncbi:hypothetical protein OPT61_g1082 [Boeremia exigua]|uniref:Uncharacterized protein n=1 Tax=Boeremia exigua TaxID=749465 RepID=A0ACC2IRY0_9PLEO|nr:hypothetical protein OPT61_g1082 [Boeremia exigua]
MEGFKTYRITKFVKSLRRIPDGEYVVDEDEYLQPWGFTIYRTYYGPGSDQQWERLLLNITNGVKDRLREHKEYGDEPAVITQAEELYKLDSRSDPAVLAGSKLEAVRQLYHEGTGGQPMNTDNDPWRVFILVDEEVLADPELGFIKCVTADYDAAASVLKSSFMGPQRYFGWLRVPCDRVLSLWFELEVYFFEQIGNHTAGGPGAWWDPSDC